jgi:hypothetical protein
VKNKKMASEREIEDVRFEERREVEKRGSLEVEKRDIEER